MPENTAAIAKRLQDNHYDNLLTVFNDDRSFDVIKKGAFAGTSVRIVIGDMSLLGHQFYEARLSCRPTVLKPFEYMVELIENMEVQGKTYKHFRSEMQAYYKRAYVVHVQNQMYEIDF